LPDLFSAASAVGALAPAKQALTRCALQRPKGLRGSPAMGRERAGPGETPYREPPEERFVYRRVSRLAQHSDELAGAGAFVLTLSWAAAIGAAWEGRPPLSVAWLIWGVATVLVAVPFVARRRLRRNAALVDPGDHTSRAELLSILVLSSVALTAMVFGILSASPWMTR
jgi:hypothetical protein